VTHRSHDPLFVASQRMALVFYFLPTLYSAYYFGRRHATMTACAHGIGGDDENFHPDG